MADSNANRMRWCFRLVMVMAFSMSLVLLACSSEPASTAGGAQGGPDDSDTMDVGVSEDAGPSQGDTEDAVPLDIGRSDVEPEDAQSEQFGDVDADPDLDEQPDTETSDTSSELPDTDDEPACPGETEEECGGQCVDLSTDSDHCGSCGHECGSDEHCLDATCEQLSGCLVDGCVGFNYCDPQDGECKQGCADDDQCSDTANATGVCRDHECVFECNPGARLCGTGCVSCPTGEGIELTSCDGGECVIHSCLEGFALCGGECAECPSDAATTSCDGNQCVDDDS